MCCSNTGYTSEDIGGTCPDCLRLYNPFIPLPHLFSIDEVYTQDSKKIYIFLDFTICIITHPVEFKPQTRQSAYMNVESG